MSDEREISSDAIVAFVFAVLSWVGFLLIGWIGAWYYSSRARRQIRDDENLRGWDLAQAARSIAFVNFLFAVVIVVVAVAIGVGVALHDQQEDASVTASSSREPTPRVIGDCLHQTRQPVSITVACADGGVVVRQISYEHWDADEAMGRGTLTINDCMPNCADGTFHDTPVQLTLRAPVDGLFTSMRLQRPNGKESEVDLPTSRTG